MYANKAYNLKIYTVGNFNVIFHRNQEIRSVASRVCCLKQWSCGLILVVIICVQICYYFTNIPNALQKDAKRHLSAVSCKRLLVGDKSEVKKAVQILRKYTHQAVPDAVYSRVTRNCTSYVEKRQYLSRKVNMFANIS